MLSEYLTDSEIQDLIQEPKHLDFEFSEFLSKAKTRDNYGHKENDFIIDRSDGSKFRIMVRQSIHNQLDFSIILGYLKPNSNILIRLTRYNGKSHEHQNTIEKTPKFYDFHIHLATERYQIARQFKPEHFAVSTGRYSDIHSAWLCFAEDCNVTFPNSNMDKLF